MITLYSSIVVVYLSFTVYRSNLVSQSKNFLFIYNKALTDAVYEMNHPNRVLKCLLKVFPKQLYLTFQKIMNG